jgi:hypothetical protein
MLWRNWIADEADEADFILECYSLNLGFIL